jgi:hypothetical protein
MAIRFTTKNFFFPFFYFVAAPRLIIFVLLLFWCQIFRGVPLGWTLD